MWTSWTTLREKMAAARAYLQPGFRLDLDGTLNLQRSLERFVVVAPTANQARGATLVTICVGAIVEPIMDEAILELGMTGFTNAKVGVSHVITVGTTDKAHLPLLLARR